MGEKKKRNGGKGRRTQFFPAFPKNGVTRGLSRPDFSAGELPQATMRPLRRASGKEKRAAGVAGGKRSDCQTPGAVAARVRPPFEGRGGHNPEGGGVSFGNRH